MLRLKDTILKLSGQDVNKNKNEEYYAKLLQILDNKSLSPVMRDATDYSDSKKVKLSEEFKGIITLNVEIF